MFKRLTCILATLLYCIATPLTALAFQPSIPAIALSETIHSPSAILVHPDTGAILLAVNEHEPRYIASVTKVMTMLLVLEAIEERKISWDDDVTVSAHARKRGGSQIWLEEGERLTVEELFLSVAVVSANDSAVALAEHVAGSEEGFVALMNARARELGCLNTDFKNACGLDLPGHVSSAFDVALMSQELLKHPQVHDFVSIRMTELKRARLTSLLVNTNRDLLANYPGYDGLKTGKTDLSGWCLAATAKRGELRLVAVVLGAASVADRKSDVVRMLDYGFANYQADRFAHRADYVGEVPISKGHSQNVRGVTKDQLVVLSPKGTKANFTTDLVPLVLEAPVNAGDKVAELVVYSDDAPVASVDVLAETPVKRASVWVILTRHWRALYP